MFNDLTDLKVPVNQQIIDLVVRFTSKINDRSMTESLKNCIIIIKHAISIVKELPTALKHIAACRP